MAEGNPHTLSAKFQQSACPADLPIYDSGISPQGLKIPLDKVIATAAPYADVFTYGDTDHHNMNVRGEMRKPENLAALKQSGFTDIGFETSKGLQAWNNAYVDGGLGRDEFKTQIAPALMAATGNEKGEWTKQILDTAEFAKANEMNLHFADPNNGRLACDAAMSAEECDIAETKARYQDTQLSADHAARLAEPAADNQQRKIFQIYGSAHYSVDNGSREGIGGRMVKMDVYASRADYESDKTILKEENDRGVMVGEIKPELVYLLDSGTLHTTCATPPALAADLEQAAAQSPPAFKNEPSTKKLEVSSLSR
ncbi:MAG: hypothetical protein KBC88_00955 [Alphaproteobacteria bacterium]|nr:hypothetical protein [Alphaproteobacteria bacterium]MBP9867483.1 hypothetical protein [Alphaproteobacteria bacterium]